MPLEKGKKNTVFMAILSDFLYSIRLFIASVFGRYDFPKAMTVIIPLWNIVVSFATTIVGVPQSLTGSYVAPYIVLLICAAIGFFLVLKLDETCIGRADLEQ